MEDYTLPLSPRGYRQRGSGPLDDPAARMNRPIVNLRHFPRLSAGQHDNPAVHEPVLAQLDDATITEAWIGTGDLDFLPARGEELADLPVRRTGKGFRFRLAYSGSDLKTLTDCNA